MLIKITIIYILLKLIAYIFWCRLGVNKLSFLIKYQGSAAIFLGVLRLIMGIVLGTYAITYLASFIYRLTSFNKWIIYFLCYVPVRIIEWGIIFIIIHIINLTVKKSLDNIPNQQLYKLQDVFYWILGGIVISCLADLPILLTFGSAPFGRIFC